MHFRRLSFLPEGIKRHMFNLKVNRLDDNDLGGTKTNNLGVMHLKSNQLATIHVCHYFLVLISNS